MTQKVSSSLRITNREQIETIIKNFATVRHFAKYEKIFEGKPSFSQEKMTELNEKYNMHLIKISKFAENYIIYKLYNVQENDSVKDLKEINKEVKIKNLNNREEVVIVIDNDKFDRQNFMAILGLLPYFYDIIDKQLHFTDIDENYAKQIDDKTLYGQYRLFEKTTLDKRCLVTIITTNQMTNVLKSIIGETNLLPCSYRIISLISLYNLLGSKTRVIGGFTKDYELLEYQPIYNGGEYQKIKDSDIIAQILNANVGDLIVCKVLLFETQPYYEYAIRQVVATSFDGEDNLDSNGLHIAY